MVRARWNGSVMAESDDTVIIDGNHYFPADAVNKEYLVPSDTTTVCPWKGRASYYSLRVNGAVNRNAAWFYPTLAAVFRGEGVDVIIGTAATNVSYDGKFQVTLADGRESWPSSCSSPPAAASTWPGSAPTCSASMSPPPGRSRWMSISG